METVGQHYTASIQKLSVHVINQIAAGEVVERPASVIKELVENSLDAGADRIQVFLESGGLECIRVLDNGKGMNPVDLKLCIEPHTTSKISQLSDLEAIRSFGFRGEALASIASVATVEIRSRTKESPQGYLLSTSFGDAPTLAPTASAVGTEISVRDLFQRVPARQKFLRGASTELAHCSKLLTEIALGTPGVTFELSHQGRRLLHYRGANLVERFKEGFDVALAPLSINESLDDITLQAVLAPREHIQDRAQVYFYINGRAVRHRLLLSALRQAYLEELGVRHEPVGIVDLRLRTEWVDVNVHPQKWEVRLLRGERLYPWLLSCMRKRLALTASSTEETSLTPSLQPQPNPPLGTSSRYSFRILDTALCAFEPQRASKAISVLRYRAAPKPITLAIPRVLVVDSPALMFFENHKDQLDRLGLSYDVFGSSEIAVKKIPSPLEESRIETFFKDLVNQFDRFFDLLETYATPLPSELTDADLRLIRDSSKSRVVFQLPFAIIDQYFGHS